MNDSDIETVLTAALWAPNTNWNSRSRNEYVRTVRSNEKKKKFRRKKCELFNFKKTRLTLRARHQPLVIKPHAQDTIFMVTKDIDQLVRL